MLSSQTPQPGKPGEGWSRGCRDGGGVSGETSQVKGRNRLRTRPEVPTPSSRGLRGEGQPAAACSGRAGPQAERKQTQASWCGPEAVLPISCLPGLQKKTFPVDQKMWDLFVCLMFNQLSLLGMFPLWEGSNSRIFLSPFLFFSLFLWEGVAGRKGGAVRGAKSKSLVAGDAGAVREEDTLASPSQ